MSDEDAAKLRAALDALPVGVAIADRDGKVAYRNRRARSLAGARDADVLAARVVDEQLASGVSQRQTVDLHGPPPRSFEVTTAPLDVGGETVGTLAVVEDVTERRHIDAMRRDFVANVSHELRTPVGALGVLAETLADERDQATIGRLCQRIAAEADRAGRIIEDLLDLSRIEAEGAAHRAELAVGDLVTASVERVAPTAERSDVRIAVNAVAELQVLADEAQLLSALTNLLDNAVKYSDAGSVVHVEVTQAEGDVVISVRDEGIGIPTRDLERIFERFYRVDRARSRQTGGTGLGLAIVRHVAANHGGDVTVSSREGEGATFTLRLPGWRR
ncbi:MAG TPA: ATP-binding protein [Acidimicrobiales bacterium]|nr:ATP-binding protein [Acidimicrobiales bacterium]